MALKNRKKLDRRVDHKRSRTEKQARTARHKQGRKAAARRLGISPTHMKWVNDQLVFAANGEPVQDVLLVKSKVPTPKAKVIFF